MLVPPLAASQVFLPDPNALSAVWTWIARIVVLLGLIGLTVFSAIEAYLWERISPRPSGGASPVNTLLVRLGAGLAVIVTYNVILMGFGLLIRNLVVWTVPLAGFPQEAIVTLQMLILSLATILTLITCLAPCAFIDRWVVSRARHRTGGAAIAAVAPLGVGIALHLIAAVSNAGVSTMPGFADIGWWGAIQGGLPIAAVFFLALLLGTFSLSNPDQSDAT